jgi:hypothetical protein
MTGALLVAVGAVLVLLVLCDVLFTTLTLGRGAGPLTRRLLGRAWRGLLRVNARHRIPRLLSNAGTVLLISTVLIWALVLWGGWWAVVLGGGAVRSASTGVPAGAGDVLYYAGFSVFTLGTGDFVAAGGTWRNLTVLASFSGLVVVTLAITYLLSVVSAVVARRALAAHVSALGRTGGEIVAGDWTAGGFSGAFVQHLVALTGGLSAVSQQHYAYPVLH